MEYIPRMLEPVITERLFKGKAIVILGPRQTGKTTLVRRILEKIGREALWLNGDESDVRQYLQNPITQSLARIFGRSEIIVIDEAQRIQDIGITLKICVDSFPNRQFIVTGSSSLELANRIKEPLTGRKFEYLLLPLSFQELCNARDFLSEKRELENRMRFGYYPEVCTHIGDEQRILQELCESYLYKDLYSFGTIRKPAIVHHLVQALALQIGNEVKYHELAQLIGADKETVERYIDLLEKTFVIFRLPALARNARNEIKKGKKVYFYDLGIRNSIIKNWNPLSLRADTGNVWENFVVAEKVKANAYKQKYVNTYFWRTITQHEIDYIEEQGGQLYAYEIKWNTRKKHRIPKSFLSSYPESVVHTITPDNVQDFLLE